MGSESIKFNEVEGRDGFVIKEGTSELSVYPSRTNQQVTNSSKVQFTNIVDYTWDVKSCIGRLVTPHYSGKYVAYVVKVGNVGAVRIVNLETQDRLLMKGSHGLIRDVEFMHHPTEVVLGFIDEYGSFYIYKIVQEPRLEQVLILHIDLEGTPARLDFRRFIWCRYIPCDGNGTNSDNAPLEPEFFQFAVLQDDIVYVMNIVPIVQQFGEGRHSFSTLDGLYLTIREHTAAVVDASFAPDGTAIATASRDGTIKFFQIYWKLDSGGEPRCLYSWAPHEGEPVTRLLFLDDQVLGNSDSESQYWKFLLSAGPDMSEIKLWNCVKWECLQTLRFSSPSPSSLRMDMNLTANFLVITDSNRKVMFVVHIEHDEERAAFRWISEISVPVPIISFSVCKAHLHAADRSKLSSDTACTIDMVFVHPKSMMKACLSFSPPQGYHNGRNESRISYESSVSDVDEEKSDKGSLSMDRNAKALSSPNPKRSKSKSPKSGASSYSSSVNRGVSSSSNTPSPTPAIKKVTPTNVTQLTQQLSSLIGVGSNNASQLSGLVFQSFEQQDIEIEKIDLSVPISVRTTSTNENASNASSSPSREVEEILSPKNPEGINYKSEISMYQCMENASYVQSMIDPEGNIAPAIREKSITPKSFKPTKAKSLGDVELLTSNSIPQVLDQVNSIMDMMRTQAYELKELKAEVGRMSDSQSGGLNQRIDETIVGRCLEKYALANESNFRRFEESVRTWMTALDKQDTSKALSENAALDLAHVLKTEIDSTILPYLHKIFEPVSLHLVTETENLVQQSEAKVKQHLLQFLHSSEFKGMVKEQVSDAVKGASQTVVSEVLRTTVCTEFEKSLKGLFQSVNDTFLKGTKEYITGLEVSLATNRKQYEEMTEAYKKQMFATEDSVKKGLRVDLETQLKPLIGELQENFLKHFQASMTREIQKAFEEQQRFLEAVVIPRPGTPALSICDSTVAQSPVMDPVARLAHLNALLESGDIIGAFTQAAAVADHNTLMYLAQKVLPTKVFRPELPVTAHLSIIQQMATDLTSFTETKLLYLQAALGVLNLQDPKVLKSLTRIVPVFQASVSRFTSLHPENELIGNLKFLEMAFLGIGNKLQNQAHQHHNIPTPTSIPLRGHK